MLIDEGGPLPGSMITYNSNVVIPFLLLQGHLMTYQYLV